MTPATPLAHFPWPLIIGGLVGLGLVLALAGGPWFRGERTKGLVWILPVAALVFGAVAAWSWRRVRAGAPPGP